MQQNLPTTSLDVETAKGLMAEAGYADGMELTVEVGSGDSAFLQVATMLQTEWAEIGVTLDIQQIDLCNCKTELERRKL